MIIELMYLWICPFREQIFNHHESCKAHIYDNRGNCSKDRTEVVCNSEGYDYIWKSTQRK